ncbi:FAD-dependent monooxygenase [Kineobactrum salinum]|uniref:Monooxygenase n=1 Tax=Kineobactrum salinum TaxID=2708301 RepID=A0A6C0TZR9_9GAMM|nr:FAD-dependent monooxygenase [Kineobactrum salinum]QIB64849.1 monooxygenase [Kineobactrum salinum]
MRPEGRDELDSLYFDYPQFDPPASIDSSGRAAVAIVGAGPVGLVAALTLARGGVHSVVLEQNSTFNDGSRAICVARQSFHILERLGAVAPFVEKALGWTTGRSFYRGQQILEFQMPHSEDEKFLPMYNLQQQYIERFLWEAASRRPEIELRWQSEVTAVEDDGAGVTLQVTDPLRSYTLNAGWVLAADGARSIVRARRGLRLEGENYEGRYVIADVQMAHDYPTIRRALFDPACMPGATVLIHRQPDNIWRIDYQLGEGESPEEATREATVRARVSAVLAEIGHQGSWELEWWSVYSANTLALADYRDGRIFFVGDSAHIVPIFGVRGLNNGLADAENIGWKLAMVINGDACPQLLDSYTPERRGATLDVFANASRSARFMTPPTAGWRLMRDAALSLALDHPFAGQFANPRQMTPYTYAHSPATLADDPAFGAGPVPGAVVPNLRLTGGDFLSDHLGHGFCGLLFTGPHWELAGELGQLLAEFEPSLRILRIGPVAGDDGATVADPDGRIAARFDAMPGSFYLLRPDMHIYGRWRQLVPDRICTALKQYFHAAREVQ